MPRPARSSSSGPETASYGTARWALHAEAWGRCTWSATPGSAGEADGRDFLAFEHVEGGGFDALPTEKKLSSAELIDWSLASAEALEFSLERLIVRGS
ncbi:MAG: hypothetical protein GY711_11515 [bacterium]|nr:hypothetical protein [bacterium]